MQELPAIQ